MNIITKRAILSGALAMAIASGSAIASTSGSASAQTALPPVKPVSAAGAHTPGKDSEADEARYAALEVAADMIGITEEQLDLELHDKSLAQVAEAHGISVTGLKAAIIANANTRIDAQVVAGVLTAENATERKAGLPDHIDGFLAHVRGAPPPAGGGRRGMNPPPGIVPTPPAVTSSGALDPVRPRGQDRPAGPGAFAGRAGRLHPSRKTFPRITHRTTPAGNPVRGVLLQGEWPAAINRGIRLQSHRTSPPRTVHGCFGNEDAPGLSVAKCTHGRTGHHGSTRSRRRRARPPRPSRPSARPACRSLPCIRE